VIGAGSWGTTFATLTAPKVPTVLWARRPELADAINATKTNPEYLPGHSLPAGLTATSTLVEAVGGAGAVVMAVPSHGFRAVFTEAVPALGPDAMVVSLTKGIEQETLSRMTEIVLQTASMHDPDLVGVVTGPNLATEVLEGQPTAAVVAMTDHARARLLQDILIGPTFRVYTNSDIVGCEMGGALKNVMAIAAGMSVGLGFGDNTRASLITRALAELTRLGVEMGGRAETFAGLAGMGDLIATCVSDRSRNHKVGRMLAEGHPLDAIVREMQMVAEGIKTTRAVLDLAKRKDVEMPIATEVGRVLHEGKDPRDAVMGLMTRQAKAES